MPKNRLQYHLGIILAHFPSEKIVKVCMKFHHQKVITIGNFYFDQIIEDLKFVSENNE